MNLCFIGFGNMARAIVDGLLTKTNWIIHASDPGLTQEHVPQAVNVYRDNLKAIVDTDVIVLAVKPQVIPTVLQEISPYVSQKTLIISIAAGISLEQLEHHLPKKQAIVRAMPNTPIAVNQGATGLYANKYVSELQKNHASTVFNTSGIVSWLPYETMLDAITALSGSGPAYVYLFAEAMMSAGEKLQLDTSLARDFTVQTLKGAIKLLEESQLSARDLRQQVTSKGGTTAAAIATLEYHQFGEIIYNAMNAAMLRAAELNQ